MSLRRIYSSRNKVCLICTGNQGRMKKARKTEMMFLKLYQAGLDSRLKYLNYIYIYIYI